MPKVNICQDDAFCYRLYDDAETIEMFGQDYLDEYGVEISEDILNEYKQTMSKYEELQDKLRVIYYKANR